MSKPSIVKTSLELDDDVPVRRADIVAGKLVLRARGRTGAVLPNKQRVNIFLDGAVIDYFKSKAGARGYQTLINEALKQAIQAESLQSVVRKTIREELRRA
jgi:BrnA antitoxin of type II toxin-antitoxin system